MNLLGIDFGRKKIGLAISEGNLPKPLKTIRVKIPENALTEIKKIVNEEKIDKIIVGFSEGIIGNESKKFAEFLKKNVNTEVELEDETLSSQNAQNQLLSMKKQRKKRKKLEDSVSAALILENYISNNA